MAPSRRQPRSPHDGAADFEAPLWRALAVFRVAAQTYALVLIWHNHDVYAHAVAAWLVGGVMTGWTAITIYCYARRSWRRWSLLVADMAIMGGALLASVPIIGIGSLAATRTLPGIAVAGPVLAWAIVGGWWGAALAAILVGAADLSTRGIVNQNTLNSSILLLLAAVAIGYVSRLNVTAQQRLARAVEVEAATRTRERLARDIHDSVLQVLALVARRAHALGGEAAELGRLAGEQEAALRVLIGASDRASAVSPDDGRVDLRVALERYASATVTVAGPATVVGLSAPACDDLVAAVGSALENVRDHAGVDAQAWVLVEEDTELVTITVRDDGPGIPPGRIEAAEAAGRLGIAQSIRGRVRDLGGTTVINSSPGLGTEVELRIPRPRT
jgi:signal transduction histidine kinase